MLRATSVLACAMAFFAVSQAFMLSPMSEMLQCRIPASLSQGLCRGGKRPVLQLRASTSVEAEEVGWWDAPVRVVESDGGMRARNLKFWIQEEHGVKWSDLEVRESALEGLGMFAKSDFSAGEELFTIPKSCCIYPELVFEDRQLGKTMKQLAKQAGEGIEVIALATFLAREKMMGTQSSYQPYIEVLPWDSSLHPLMWTEPEVELLQGTYAYDQVLEFRDQVEAATELFEPVLNPKGWKAVFQPMESERMSPEAFGFMMRGAFASVLSRAFDSDIGASGDDGEGLEQRVLIPLMDVINHDNDGSPTISFDATATRKADQTLVVSCGKDLKAGEELSSFYGNKPNWQMLTNYGFVSTNPECQETTLKDSLDAADPLYDRKSTALAAAGLDPKGQLFDIQTTREPSELLWGFQRICAMTSEAELASAEQALKGQVSAENEQRALERLAAVVERRQHFIAEAKAAAHQAGERGQETLVRRAVASVVSTLFDSEAAAVRSLEERRSKRMAAL